MSDFKFTEQERDEILDMLDEGNMSPIKEIDRIEQIINERDRWIRVEDRLPDPLQTVWISDGKGWTTLGCRGDYEEDENGELCWCWAVTNGIIYESEGEIVAESEWDDLNVRFWQPLPSPPKSEK